MHKLIGWIQFVLVPWLGAPGVFIVAFLDASFLSLPEINDVIVVTAGQPKHGQLQTQTNVVKVYEK